MGECEAASSNDKTRYEQVAILSRGNNQCLNVLDDAYSSGSKVTTKNCDDSETVKNLIGWDITRNSPGKIMVPNHDNLFLGVAADQDLSIEINKHGINWLMNDKGQIIVDGSGACLTVDGNTGGTHIDECASELIPNQGWDLIKTKNTVETVL
ncbi:uncharacterized protein IL334_004348 [Kwoniella shivajii]|uniref:Ricin B lectin domain-containing protein n=1 Tax=Kwoniella shivajii TaxID=564305 RepID=A0ABZ1D442_9TREE|nr:hypothetical protein IL334_004348 [Kwoniella shivajii]